MADIDLENRVRELERTVLRLAKHQLDQQREIDRLKDELSHEITQRAIQSLTPWPTHV